MSLGYAEKLSFRSDLGGHLGSEELSESPESLNEKIDQLVDKIRASKKIVAFTGAGISTACGIPDFRGPKGVWTLQKAGLPIPKASVTFAAAKPSLTHQALLGLANTGKLTYIVSQNVDCLHLRSGIPRTQIAELHGNCFVERCSKCRHEYIRDFEVETVGFKATGRECLQSHCGGILRDHVLDWEDALPEDELRDSERHAREADLAICLGTSLQITPSCNIPLKTVKAGGELVIINLQRTPKDKKASLVIHARCDLVMQQIMEKLGYSIPTYRRTDRYLLECRQSLGHASAGPHAQLLIFRLCNSHDPNTNPPLVSAASFNIFQAGTLLTSKKSATPPFTIEAAVGLPAELEVQCSLQLSGAADEDKRNPSFSCKFNLKPAARRSQATSIGQCHCVLTQEQSFGKLNSIKADSRDISSKRQKL